MWLGMAACTHGQMTSLTLYLCIGDGVTDRGELVSSEIELWR